jgi:1,2-phenylacetyl-CoA epoxidase catalytic subunit
MEHASPYQRISHIGGHGWRFTQEQAIQGILNEQYLFYIRIGEKAVELTIGQYEDIVYLKTAADGAHLNHLLRLPECACEPIAFLQKMSGDDEILKLTLP